MSFMLMLAMQLLIGRPPTPGSDNMTLELLRKRETGQAKVGLLYRMYGAHLHQKRRGTVPVLKALFFWHKHPQVMRVMGSFDF